MTQATSNTDTSVLAEQLFEAFESGKPISPLTEQNPSLGAADGYRIQRSLLQRHLSAGRSVVARKAGLTSKAIQAQMNVDQPDYGVVLDGFVFENGAALCRREHKMIAPKIEGELAFILKDELRGPGIDAVQVLANTVAVVPALEIIDSRIEGWRIKLADTIADNASGWGLVLGETLTAPDSLDLTTVGMVLEKDGEILATGAGASVYDHPARAVAWLANTLSVYGEGLPAREPILSGSFTAAIDGSPGQYRARFGSNLGSVEVRMAE